MKHPQFAYKIICILALCSISSFVSAQDYIDDAHTTDKSFKQLIQEAEDHFDTVGRGKGVGYKAFKRWEYWNKRNLNKDGRINPADYTRKEFNHFKKNNPAQSNRAITGVFTKMGPTSAVNTSTWSSHLGRITSIDIDPNNPSHIIVGAPNGGVWKTTNTGATWTPLFNYESVIKVYAVEISHANSDHYFVGTSGGGISISTDGGLTWSLSNGESNSTTYNTITMHPTDASILFAIGQSNGETYKSTDSGNNWTSVDNHIDSMYDLEFKPGDPTTIYISGGGIIKKSTDTGDTWSTLTGPWSTSTGHAIMLGVTPHDANYVYALQEVSGGFGGLYLSTDSGTTWVTQDAWDGTNNIMGYNQDEQSGQAPRDMDVIVSTTDKTEVHVAGTETWKTHDSGATWSKTSQWSAVDTPQFIHADVDILIYEGSRIFAGTDGGIFFSDDTGNNWTDISTGIGVREFYRIGASETEVDRVCGGSQDNGTGVVINGTWFDWLGADGMETFISWDDEDIMFGSIQFGSLRKSINGGNGTSGISQSQSGDDGAWVTPLEQDPLDPNTLYQAKNEVHKSTDLGSTWTPISNFGGGLIFEMKIAPSDNQIIYIAFSHDLYKTTDGGATWTNVSPSVSYSSINYITIHPSNPNRVALNLSGASEKVLETPDGGTTWSDISSNLPNISSQCFLYEDNASNGMYVGMGIGIYYKDITTMGNWSLVNGSTAMPNVNISELELRNGIIYISTYGRGLWKTDIQAVPIDNINCTQAYDLGTNYQAVTAVGPSSGNGSTDPASAHANWFIWTPTETGAVTIKSCGGGVDTKLLVHTGTCGTLTLADTADNECEMSPGGATLASELLDFPVTANVPIFLEWTDAHSSEGFQFSILKGVPKHETCETALEIAECNTFPARPPVAGNGSLDPASTHASWYKWTSSTTGFINISSCGAGVDTKLFVHAGTCGSLTLVGTSDNDCSIGSGGTMLASQLMNIPVTANVPIYLEWTDAHSASAFDFTISMDLNYTCETAETIPSPGSYVAPNMLLCGGSAGGSKTDATHAVWYQYVAPADGTLSIFSCNGGVDTRLWIYDGGCTVLNALANDDDTCEMSAGSQLFASRVTNLGLVAGQTILIEWDSRWSTNGFDFELEYNYCGCTDATADNYDQHASCDDGSCVNCDPSINLTGVIPTGTYHASNTLTANGQVTPASGGEVILKAGSTIDLTAGFEVDLATGLTAEIEDCGATTLNSPTIEKNARVKKAPKQSKFSEWFSALKEQFWNLFD